jgi:hypothetical protein
MPTWDDRIDEAARQLTDGEPGAGFRTRVLARLDERPRWSRAWMLAPAAAIAIVVLVVMPRERVGDVALAPEVTEVGLKADTTTAPVGLKADTTTAAEVGLKADTTTASVGLRADATTAPVGLKADGDMPLVSELAPAPIDVVPLTVAASGVDALPDLAPLAIEEISVDPIDVAQ